MSWASSALARHWAKPSAWFILGMPVRRAEIPPWFPVDGRRSRRRELRADLDDVAQFEVNIPIAQLVSDIRGGQLRKRARYRVQVGGA